MRLTPTAARSKWAGSTMLPLLWRFQFTRKYSSIHIFNTLWIQGPLDKQIEMKTSDGRRRITPIFILPNSDSANSMMANPAVNGVNGNSTSSESMAKYHMQSSSSGAKSKIRIEKVDGIVEPNVRRRRARSPQPPPVVQPKAQQAPTHQLKRCPLHRKQIW